MPEFWIGNVDAQGRITIPAELRRQLGLHPGTRVVLTPREDGSILVLSLKSWKRQQPAKKRKSSS